MLENYSVLQNVEGFYSSYNKICLTSNQAKYIYKKIKEDNLINVETVKQEIEEDRLDEENDSEEENPYQTMIIKDSGRVVSLLTYHKWNNDLYLTIL